MAEDLDLMQGVIWFKDGPPSSVNWVPDSATLSTIWVND